MSPVRIHWAPNAGRALMQTVPAIRCGSIEPPKTAPEQPNCVSWSEVHSPCKRFLARRRRRTCRFDRMPSSHSGLSIGRRVGDHRNGLRSRSALMRGGQRGQPVRLAGHTTVVVDRRNRRTAAAPCWRHGLRCAVGEGGRGCVVRSQTVRRASGPSILSALTVGAAGTAAVGVGAVGDDSPQAVTASATRGITMLTTTRGNRSKRNGALDVATRCISTSLATKV